MTEAILEVPNLKEGLNTKEAYGMGWGRIEAFSNGEFRVRTTISNNFLNDFQ